MKNWTNLYMSGCVSNKYQNFLELLSLWLLYPKYLHTFKCKPNKKKKNQSYTLNRITQNREEMSGTYARVSE